MTWHEDLRSVEWNGRKYLVLDKIKEEGRIYLGLAIFEDVAATANAMDAGRPRSLPSDLTWVEETGTEFAPLSRKAVKEILKRKGDRAKTAFGKP
jgi:hypothetical protein